MLKTQICVTRLQCVKTKSQQLTYNFPSDYSLLSLFLALLIFVSSLQTAGFVCFVASTHDRPETQQLVKVSLVSHKLGAEVGALWGSFGSLLQMPSEGCYPARTILLKKRGLEPTTDS